MTNEAVARDLLRQAHELHDQHRIPEALDKARRAIDVQPALSDAWVYLGTTLITRRLEYVDGLEALERARDLAPDDPGVQYSLGWCYEFVGYRLEKRSSRPFRDPDELYDLAIEHLRRCIDLDPEPKLKEDAEDLLQSLLDRM